MFSSICSWTNGWANNRDAGDLRHHRAHYDVTVMSHANYTCCAIKLFRIGSAEALSVLPAFGRVGWRNNQTVRFKLKLLLHFFYLLTQRGRVTHICVVNLTVIGSDNGLWPGRPSHYLNQCWNTVNWALRNHLQWIGNRNSYIIIKENAFQNAVWKIAAILSRDQCVYLMQLFIWAIVRSKRYFRRTKSKFISCNALPFVKV